MPYMQAGRRTQDPWKRWYDSRQTYIHRLFQPSRLAGLTNSFQHVGLCMYMMKLSLNASVILCWYIVNMHVYMHIYYGIHMYTGCFCLFSAEQWMISDSTFTWVPSKARSSPDFLIIARTDARTTLGVKPVRWFKQVDLHGRDVWHCVFLSGVVVCDALFHHFSIFFQCFIISFIFFFGCQPGGQLEASLSLMCMNEHGWFTSLRTFPILLLGLEEALRRARAFAAAGADILFVEAPESEVPTGGNPAANRRLHRRFVVGNLTDRKSVV